MIARKKRAWWIFFTKKGKYNHASSEPEMCFKSFHYQNKTKINNLY